jgi:hypothetical protein
MEKTISFNKQTLFIKLRKGNERNDFTEQLIINNVNNDAMGYLTIDHSGISEWTDYDNNLLGSDVDMQDHISDTEWVSDGFNEWLTKNIVPEFLN